MMHICVNGQFRPADEPALRITNKGYRYGDGLFETMKLWDGRLLLDHAHFIRLYQGMQQLGYPTANFPSAPALKEKIMELCRLNDCAQKARVRLTVWAGNGNLFQESEPAYTIEAEPLTAIHHVPPARGQQLVIYPQARKSCDQLANLKSANFLPYAAAARFARANGADDCLLLNTHDRLADTCIANIFLVKDNLIYTPSLSEAPVAGVMRAYFLQLFQVVEQPLTVQQLQDADEVFLTNAIRGVMRVDEIEGKRYGHQRTDEIFLRYLQTITG